MRITETPKDPWWQTTEFDFIRVPKELFRNPYYSTLSAESKLLYGFLLDRASLSQVSGTAWRTPEGEPFVIFTLKEIQERLHCADKKATRLLRSLVSSNLILINRPKRDGPYHIVIRQFNDSKQRLGNRQNNECPTVKTTTPASSKQRRNNTDNNKIDMNNTDTIRRDWAYEIKKNISYDILCMELPRDKVDAIVEVMTDTVSAPMETQWIGGQPRTRAEVQKRLLAADDMRIRYIFDHMKRNTVPIQSYRSYYLSRLWEPEGMVDAFYEAWVRRDGAC